MAKAIVLSSDALSVPQVTPKAATPARSHGQGKQAQKTELKVEQIPLQIRIPREEARAIKIAAAEQEQTLSEFMLSCFHAYIRSGKHE